VGGFERSPTAEVEAMTEEFWRAQVERCLRLAMETYDPAVAEALRQLAEEYRARADELRDTNNRKGMSGSDWRYHPRISAWQDTLR
jgi:hypothetical protein